MRDRQATGTLTALRDDRLAFTVLAVIVLFANLLHPLAEARAAGGPNAWIICTTYGEQIAADGEVIPGLADDCPHCISGSCTGFVISAVAPHLSYVFSYADHALSSAVESVPSFRLVRGLPAIRAPPVFV